jgi:DNA-binding transcriptional MocR family regulator
MRYNTESLVIFSSPFYESLAAGVRICWVIPGRRRVEVERLKFLNTAAISGIGQMAIAKALVSDGWDRLLRDVQ